ncbi:MAG TPA: hypothetical protein VK641_06960, partial [Terriglobales bacterium]|nr:hypothetical protein [Terriglobales bacterium]
GQDLEERFERGLPRPEKLLIVNLDPSEVAVRIDLVLFGEGELFVESASCVQQPPEGYLAFRTAVPQ